MENLKNTDWNEQLRRLDEKHAMNVANLQQLLSEEQERYVADRCRLTEEKTKSESREAMTSIANEEQYLQELIKADKAAEYVGMKRGTLYNLVSRGEIPHIKKGKSVYFRRADLNLWKRGEWKTEAEQAKSKEEAEDAELERLADEYIKNHPTDFGKIFGTSGKQQKAS